MRGHVRKRGNKWVAVIDLGRDENGKRKQKWLSGFDTEEEAQKGATEFMYKYDIGEILDTPNITVDKYLLEWVETHKSNVTLKTYKSYKAEIINHIGPHFEKVKLDKLKPLNLQRYYTKKEKTHSPTTVNYHHRILRVALEQAVTWGMINSNPCGKVTPPKKAKKKFDTITLAQAKALIDHFKGHENDMSVTIALAFFTGMRRGEVLGLTWNNVDLNDKTIHVEQSRQRVGKDIIVTGVKSKTSIRTIPIFNDLYEILQKEKTTQKKNKLLWGKDYNKPEQDFVCRRDNGDLSAPDYVYRKLKRTATNLEISSSLRFHDLRHSFATWMMENGVHPKVVSDWLGHSDINITMDIYSHVNLDAMRFAVAQVEQNMV